MANEFWDFVRGNIIGKDAIIDTPFGRKALLYADHTASGRSVRFIEDYLCQLYSRYGNTHTDDDFTGNFSTTVLEMSLEKIKKLLNAGEHHKIIMVGNGATGAIQRLQQILGVYLPPAYLARVRDALQSYPDSGAAGGVEEWILSRRPVVFVGPYEHHSNEVTWRECYAEVVEIGLTDDGLIDLTDLEEKLARPEYAGRQRVGSFSAASNVSGVRSDVFSIARLLHRYQALAFFDFAALAPYARIDVNHDAESYFDAVFFSPHKLIGGPGTSGVLVFHDKIYRTDLPPTHGGGGTVDFVNRSQQHYLASIEGREMAGTPGIPQVWKTALVMELKEKMGPEEIEEREHEIVMHAYSKISAHPNVEVIGTARPENRIGILSFLVKDGTSYLHPRFVARILNDLFGIQSRGGCSCAGPYGHRLLAIGDERSEYYRQLIVQGKCGVKPGWTRITLHFLLTDEELDYLCDAVLFVATEGKYFLPLYRFDIYTGSWHHVDWANKKIGFGIDAAVDSERDNAHTQADAAEAARLRSESFSRARELAAELRERYSDADIQTLRESPFPFEYYDKKQPEQTGTHR